MRHQQKKKREIPLPFFQQNMHAFPFSSIKTIFSFFFFEDSHFCRALPLHVARAFLTFFFISPRLLFLSLWFFFFAFLIVFFLHRLSSCSSHSLSTSRSAPKKKENSFCVLFFFRCHNWAVITASITVFFLNCLLLVFFFCFLVLEETQSLFFLACVFFFIYFSCCGGCLCITSCACALTPYCRCLWFFFLLYFVVLRSLPIPPLLCVKVGCFFPCM